MKRLWGRGRFVRGIVAVALATGICLVTAGTASAQEIFAASKGPVQYYVVEHDPRFGDPTFDPFEAAQKGFEYLDCVTF